MGDLEGVLKELNLTPPYNFVCVAAASTQVLRFLEKHPEQVKSIVLCNPAPGVDPSRAGALNDRADLAEKEGMRGVMGITLDKSYPPELRDRATYEAYRGRYLANDPVGFGLAHRMLAMTNMLSPAAEDQGADHGGGRQARHRAAAGRHRGAGEENSRRTL